MLSSNRASSRNAVTDVPVIPSSKTSKTRMAAFKILRAPASTTKTFHLPSTARNTSFNNFCLSSDGRACGGGGLAERDILTGRTRFPFRRQKFYGGWTVKAKLAFICLLDASVCGSLDERRNCDGNHDWNWSDLIVFFDGLKYRPPGHNNKLRIYFSTLAQLSFPPSLRCQTISLPGTATSHVRNRENLVLRVLAFASKDRAPGLSIALRKCHGS